MPVELPPLPISLPNLTTTQITALIVPLVATIPYILYNTFPTPPQVIIHPSIATLKGESEAKKRLKQLYPEDVYEGGAYAKLPLGSVRYWTVGPEDGVKLVLICGFGMPTLIWKDVVPYLTKAGFRVLLYDLYGRGYSEAPEVVYDDNLYINQIAQLLQYLKWETPYFAGLSMGGGILAAFAAKFPHLTGDRLVFIAPAGLMKDSDLPTTYKALFSPLGQYITSLPGVRSLIMARVAGVPSVPTPVGILEELVRLQQITLPGYVGALSSSMREGPIRGQQTSYSTVGSSGRKVLVIWGSKDPQVPYRLSEEFQKRVPQAKLVSIPDAGHEITVESSDVVGPAMVEFLTAP